MALTGPLLTRKRVIKVALETAGADRGTKVPGTQALIVFDPVINPTAPYQERNDSGLYRGPSVAGVVGERSGICTFSVELRGTGAAGMEPGLAILLQACSFLKALEVYQVHSAHADDLTVSIDVWEDGKKKGLAGASGKVTFAGMVGQRMMISFEFSGIWQAVANDDLPAYSPSTEPPIFIQSGTFLLDDNAFGISSFSLDMGNIVIPRRAVAGVGGISHYMIPYNAPILTIDPEGDLVDSYDFYGIWLAGTPAAVSLVLGNATDEFTFTIPVVVCSEISEGDRDDIAIENFVGRCLHSADPGNDSVKIEAAAPA